MPELGTTALLGPVELRLPAVPAMARVLRLAASGMADLAGFTIDAIEDVRIAVSEVMIALIEHGSGHEVEVQLLVDGDFTVKGRTRTESFDVTHPDLALCRMVLADVCIHHEISFDSGWVEIVAVVRHDVE